MKQSSYNTLIITYTKSTLPNARRHILLVDLSSNKNFYFMVSHNTNVHTSYGQSRPVNHKPAISKHLVNTPEPSNPPFTRQNAFILEQEQRHNGPQGNESQTPNTTFSDMASSAFTGIRSDASGTSAEPMEYPEPRVLEPEFNRIAREEGLVQGEQQDVAATTTATTESVQEFDFTDADQVEQYGGDIFEQLRRFDNLTNPVYDFPVPAPNGSECRLRVYQVAWRLEYESSVGQGKRRRLFYKPLCYGNTTVIDPNSDMIPAHRVNSFMVANGKQFGTGPK